MLPSEVPRLATDSPVRVFPGVWKLLSFLRLPPRDRSPSLTLLSLFIFYILSYLLSKTMGCLSGCLVSCQHSEVVLWNLLSVQMLFRWICGGESGLPILFLRHLRTAPVQDLCMENYKILMKEIRENINQLRDLFRDWKTQYSEDNNSPPKNTNLMQCQ